MNGLDLLVLVALVATGVAGFRLGLLARLCSWLGLFAGLVVTTRFMDVILRAVGDPRRGDQALAMAVALFLGCWTGKGLGMAIGRGLHRRLPGWSLPRLDRTAGGLLGVAGIAVIVWLAVPILAVVPGWPARQVRASAVARLVHDRAPAPPAALTRLRRYVEAGAFPSVVGGLQRAIPVDLFPAAAPDSVPLPDQSAPGPDKAASQSIDLATVARSVVKVEAQACDRILDGTGFVVDGRRVLTNAHVVAGATSVSVVDADGNRRTAEVVAFDAGADAALLRVDLTIGRPLALTDGSASVTNPVEVDVMGHPGGGPLRIAHGSVRRRVVAKGRDIFDRETAVRDVLVMTVGLAPGDSGSPVVGPDGMVVGMAFAVAPDRPRTAYALDTAEIRRFLEARPVGRIDRRRCIG